MMWINIGAWAISAVLLGWLLFDAFRIETSYDHDLLVSSVEGEIEKEIQDHMHMQTPAGGGS